MGAIGPPHLVHVGADPWPQRDPHEYRDLGAFPLRTTPTLSRAVIGTLGQRPPPPAHCSARNSLQGLAYIKGLSNQWMKG